MTTLGNYYNRSADEIAKGYDRHLFRAGHILQSAELNEIQDVSVRRLKTLGDALFKDGDIVRDARLSINQETGHVVAESGAVYLNGAVRGVPPAEFVIDTTGTVVIGIRLQESVVTEFQDPSLNEPAIDVRAYGEPGAARLKVVTAWGVLEDGAGDDSFYPIYYIDDGVLRAKEAPPVMDSVSQAIARYDVDSSGSNYVVSGMLVRRLDDEDGQQVYTVDHGRARVNGFGVTLATARRLRYDARPELLAIDSEPVTSTTVADHYIRLARPPARTITQVRITAEKTVTLTHATFAGAADPLPDSSIIQIVEVKQGATVYASGQDYLLSGQTVDWSPTGGEPAPGSSYTCTYRYIRTVTPTDPDARGFKVSGAVPGTLIMTSYTTMLPRIDRLCMDASGAFVWIQGVSTDYNPVRPPVPSNMITLAQVRQNWDETTEVSNDGVRTVPMSDIEGIFQRLDTMSDLIGRQLLISDIAVRETGAKKGIFTDPFLSDEHRDLGIAQTAAVFSGILTLPIAEDVKRASADPSVPQTCAYVPEVVIEQNERTGAMKINPYMVYDVPGSVVALDPAVDRWTEIQTVWTSPVTQKFSTFAANFHLWGRTLSGVPQYTTTSSVNELLSAKSSQIQYLRQIDVRFVIKGFGPGEELVSVTFDGIAVTPV